MSDSILYITPENADYMSVTLLHGLRTLLGYRVVDWPRYGCAYSDYKFDQRGAVYGRGFTAFFDLPEIFCDRSDVLQKLKNGYFRLVIFSDIANQADLFSDWKKYLNPANAVLVDGQDGAPVVPHAGKWWRDPLSWWKLIDTKNYLYYKREWTSSSHFNLWHRMLPAKARRCLPFSKNLRKISFAIPRSKITASVPDKTKDFPVHIVDEEIASMVSGGRTSYSFSSEEEYYKDIQASRFGITTKRSGWDCMRHYEIAANGAVPCFRHLGDKEDPCAPHGLVAGKNCLAYENANDLFQQTGDMSSSEYLVLQKGAMQWAQSNTTEVRAKEFLRSLYDAGIRISGI